MHKKVPWGYGDVIGPAVTLSVAQVYDAEQTTKMALDFTATSYPCQYAALPQAHAASADLCYGKSAISAIFSCFTAVL